MRGTISEPESVGQILRGFRQLAKAELAQMLMRKDNGVKLDDNGVVVCKKCGGERMFHYVGYGKDCWFPVICRCEGEEMERKKLDEAVAENRKASGIYGERARMNFNRFPRNSDNSRAFNSALNFCKNFTKASEAGQGIYIYGATGTYKTLLVLCIANFLLDVGVRVKFVEACDVLFPIGNGNLYNANGQNENATLIAECISADLLILDNLGGDDFATSRGVTASAAQRRLARLIEGRYGKSTVFTSNYSLNDLGERCNVKVNTIDRIREMATRTFELGAQSRRAPAAIPEIEF